MYSVIAFAAEVWHADANFKANFKGRELLKYHQVVSPQLRRDKPSNDRSDMANGGQASPIRRALCRAFQNSSSRPRLVRLRRAENSLPQLP